MIKSWKRLEDVFTRRLKDVLKTSWRRLEVVLKTFLQDVLKTTWRDVLKMSWRRFCKTSYILKTFWKRLLKTKTKDIFKTSSSRYMFAGTKSKQVKKFNNIVIFSEKISRGIYCLRILVCDAVSQFNGGPFKENISSNSQGIKKIETLIKSKKHCC